MSENSRDCYEPPSWEPSTDTLIECIERFKNYGVQPEEPLLIGPETLAALIKFYNEDIEKTKRISKKRK